MQNTVYERKQNGEDFFSLLSVTCSCSGNCPANGLVTEQPQYYVVICIFSIWQNTETMLFSNGLRFIFTCPLFLAQPITFHIARQGFARHASNEYIIWKIIGVEESINYIFCSRNTIYLQYFSIHI